MHIQGINRRARLFNKQQSKCFWCGKECQNPSRQHAPKLDVMFTTDHVRPRSRGGPNTEDNVVGACFPCNQLRNRVESKLLSHKKPPFVVKAKYLPVGFLKFPVIKGDQQ